MADRSRNKAARCVLIDLDPKHDNREDRRFLRSLRKALAAAGRAVVTTGGMQAARAAQQGVWRRGFAFVLSALGLDGRPAANESRLSELAGALTKNDAIVFPATGFAELEELPCWLPRLRLTAPLPVSAHFRFGAGWPQQPAGHDPQRIMAKLRSGSPFRNLFFHADSDAAAEKLSRLAGVKVHSLQRATKRTELARLFAAGKARPNAGLVVEQFGPVVVIVSALQGHAGSSTALDAQCRYFIDRGFIVARLLVDHHPQRGAAEQRRIAMLLAEELDSVRPHLHAVYLRDRSLAHAARLTATEAFKTASPLLRSVLMLGAPIARDPALAAWLAPAARLTVANHLMHFGFAATVAPCPVIVATQGVFSEQLDAHGIPAFVPPGDDAMARRRREERKLWSAAAACLSASPHDHEQVKKYARRSALARPYAAEPRAEPRPWQEVLQANRLDAVEALAQFDLVLWGSRHRGNVEGIHWFLKEVRPLQPQLADARVLIVGRVADGLARWALREPGIYCSGPVDRIDDFLGRATVAVIPDRAGSGISIKLMEAAALGRPFVSTREGLRGLNLEGSTIKPPRDARQFARELATLLTSVPAREARAAAGRRLYELNCSKAAYEQAWDELAGQALADAAAADPAKTPERRQGRTKRAAAKPAKAKTKPATSRRSPQRRKDL